MTEHADASSIVSTDSGIGPQAQPYLECARLDDAPTCFACCATYFPPAAQRLLSASATCSCPSMYCGPAPTNAPSDAAADASPARDDAGTMADAAGEAPTRNDDAAADGAPGLEAQVEASLGVQLNPGISGSPFGLGACGADMCSLEAAASQQCVTCVLALLDGSQGMPLCPDGRAACKADPVCAPLLKCSANCPGAVSD
jgi:hypothetical protein